MGTGKNKANVASETMIYKIHSDNYGTATRELFTQFLIRINSEIKNSIVAHFSTLKFVQSQNFAKFRYYFKASYKSGFLVPANTFDNVKGQFPIGFYIWNLNEKKNIESFNIDVYNLNGYIGEKLIHTHIKGTFLIDWLRSYYDKSGDNLGFLRVNGPDVQNNLGVFITTNPTENDIKKHFIYNITLFNVLQMSIYHSVRISTKATWLNDRDQYLFPNEGWQNDFEFQNDCLAFTLFNNNIQSQYGTNHWIPFTEYEVNAQAKFESNFMTNFIKGKIKHEAPTTDLFSNAVVSPSAVEDTQNKPLVFSQEAIAVFDAGRELWKYYHEIASLSRNDYNVNASLYDIREYFQGRNDKGRMNSKSDDATYNQLIAELRSKLAVLADKIKPKVYEYGFLKE